jgi:hypothetical protein
MRKINEIAAEIRRDWKKVNFAAVPHLEAMEELATSDINAPYYSDTAKDMVIYFLANATSWRGDTARRVKAELSGML